ncbi:MAG: tetratricopeptide repeat protein [Elusimicrobiota bacterium]|nr:tetratricopeptide repeat protein [Elusimicrobiota bacterium]
MRGTNKAAVWFSGVVLWAAFGSAGLSASVIGGGYPGEYLLLYSPTAVSLSMGGTPSDGASSAFFNPALLSGLRSKELTFMRSSLLSGGVYTASFLAFPLSERRVMSVGFVSCGVEGAEWVDGFGIGNRGTFSDKNSAYSAAYSFPAFRDLDMGAAFKVVTQDIHTYSAQGFGLDAGMRYIKRKKFVPSLSFQNIIAPSMTLRENGEPDDFPLNARLSLDLKPMKKLGFKIDAVYENLTPAEGEKSCSFFAAGAEYLVGEVFRVRAGYNPSSFSAGFGVSMGRTDFDWAMQIRDEGNFFTAGLSVRWGMMPQLWQKNLRDREKFLNDFSKNLKIEKSYTIEKGKKADEAMEEAVKMRYIAAKRYVKNYEYSSAMNEINLLLKLNPEHEKAIKLKKDISSGRLKADLLYALSYQYYKNEDYKTALKKVKKAMRLNRDHPDAKFLYHMIQARIFIDAGDYYQAKEHLLTSFKMYPDDSECLMLLNGINDLLKAGKKGIAR